MINYRKGGEKVRVAFFKWNKTIYGKPGRLIGFVAGYNAAKQEIENKKKEA
jgi:hypothetical protein